MNHLYYQIDKGKNMLRIKNPNQMELFDPC